MTSKHLSKIIVSLTKALGIDNGNRYLYHINNRRVPNPTGQSFVGGSGNSEVLQPRGEYKFRDSEQMNSDCILYPRKDTWFR